MNQNGRPPDAIFVPVGGGGLIAGISAYMKYLSPTTRIVGVEAEGLGLPGRRHEGAGRRVTLPFDTPGPVRRRRIGGAGRQGDVQGGAALRRRGDHRLHRRDLRRHQGSVRRHPRHRRARRCAGGGGLEEVRAPAIPAAEGPARQTLVAVVSGANVNFDRLRHISERAEVGEQREVILGVTIPEVRAASGVSARPWASAR
jgi:threonine dehydratase